MHGRRALQDDLGRLLLMTHYGGGIASFAAGSKMMLNPFAQAVLAVLVTYIGLEAWHQAKAYAGDYCTPNDTKSEAVTKRSLSLDAGPGTKVAHFIHNGSDMFAARKIICGSRLVDLESWIHCEPTLESRPRTHSTNQTWLWTVIQRWSSRRNGA